MPKRNVVPWFQDSGAWNSVHRGTVTASSCLVNVGTCSSHLTLSADVGLSLIKWGWGCMCVKRSLLTTKASLTLPSPPFSLPPSLSSARARPFVLWLNKNLLQETYFFQEALRYSNSHWHQYCILILKKICKVFEENNQVLSLWKLLEPGDVFKRWI